MSIDTLMRDTTLADIDRTSDSAESRPMDGEAFRAFYDRTSRPVWVYLWRMTGDEQLADDLLQETYYRFFRAGAAHESEAHRRNSLFCIATNVARDARRRRRNATFVPLPEHGAGAEGLVDAGMARRATSRTDLGRAMQRLKPVQREMLWLAYALGASHAEIANVIGVKVASVRQLLFRARRTLVDLLEGGKP